MNVRQSGGRPLEPGDLLWELRLQLRDGATKAFRGLMNDRRMPTTLINGKRGQYGWSLAEDGRTASIFVRAIYGPAVCWAGDWSIARHHLQPLGRNIDKRIMELARPTNLVSFEPRKDEQPRMVRVEAARPAQLGAIGVRARERGRTRADAARRAPAATPRRPPA